MLTSELIKQKAKELGAAVCGIGKVYAESNPQRDPKMILPNARCIIGFGFPVPKGLYRAMQNGNQQYTYTTMGVKYIDEELAEIFLLKIGGMIENYGYDACLQKAIPNLRIKGDKTTNPEVVDTYELIHAEAVEEGKPVPDVIIDFGKAAKACGIGSCWIHRAKEEFESPEGKEILRSLGIEGEYEGIGHCVLGYPAADPAPSKPRKPDYIRKV